MLGKADLEVTYLSSQKSVASPDSEIKASSWNRGGNDDQKLTFPFR